jgi:probable F420-dependent oxidoreductase
VHLGCFIFQTAETPGPGEIARLVEERGFESLFFPDHTHTPAIRATRYPPGGDLPYEYNRAFDPFISMTAAACATTTLRVGVGICLVVERDPIILAKQIASLDHVSEGRLLLGVGGGWNREEMRNHGTDPKTRMRLMRERIEAMKTIWARDEATYQGELVSFERIWMWPKPYSRPHPPILVGGNGPTVHDRVLAFGDHWMPNVLDTNDDPLLERIADIQRRAADAGRDIGVTVHGAPTRPERLERYREAGIERAIFHLPSGDRGEIERRLDTILERTASLSLQ